MKSVKQFLLILLIVCFANVNAQYKFADATSVTVELTLVQTQIFKNVMNTDKDVMMKNKVKNIHFKNSRGDVNYLYNKSGLLTEFSISEEAGKTFSTYEYDANNNCIKYFFAAVQNNITDGVTYNYKFNERGNIKSASTEPNVMFSPAKDYAVEYYNKSFPDAPSAIRYYKGGKAPEGTSMIESPLYESIIESDEQGRITKVIDKDNKEMIKAVYTDTGVNISYLGDDFITRYTISNNVITNITNEFVSTDFKYNDNGLIDSITLLSKDDNNISNYKLEYEYYQ